jgi:beta-glucosidase
LSQFPPNFRWGTTTSSFQIEGAIAEDGRGESVWDMFVRRSDAIADGQNADIACDHYHRRDEDIDWMGKLGANAYRFSVAWSRVLPQGIGHVEPRGLDFYDRLVDGLLARGIEPLLCLFHWDFPLELFRRGGWLNRDSARWFADYTDVVVRRLSDRVSQWITHNEPQVFINEGHFWGRHAPGIRLPLRETLLAAHHALLGHGYAVDTIRASAAKTPSIGYAPAGPIPLPVANTADNVALAYDEACSVTHESVWNMAWWLDPVVFGRYPVDGMQAFGAAAPVPAPGDLEAISRPLDFIGLNLYWGPQVDRAHRGPTSIWQYPSTHPRNAFGWAITPEILYWGPRFMAKRYKRPIIVSENGISCLDSIAVDGGVHDAERVDFLTRHLAMLRAVMAAGVDVRGYYHWTLLDNFEWAEGYKQRFGLLYTDFETCRRIPKDSFFHYRDLIASSGAALPNELALTEPAGWEKLVTIS